jgi:hypothetical protein
MLTAMLTLSVSVARAQGPTIPLPADDRSVIDQWLGKGVVGQALPAPTIGDTARYLLLREGARTYQVVSGPNAGQRETFLYARLKRPAGASSWRYDVGATRVNFLNVQNDGSILLTASQETKDGVVTKYTPAEPFLISGFAPGEERRTTMAVKVYDLGHPDAVTHEGRIDVSCRYVGAYRVTVPVGTHDAVLIKWVFSGRVGPASFDDVQYRLFALDLGMLALIEKRDVSAFLIYNVHTKEGKVLAVRPP